MKWDPADFIVSCCNKGGGIYRLSDGLRLWGGDVRGIDVAHRTESRPTTVYVASNGRVRALALLEPSRAEPHLREAGCSKRNGDWHGLKILRRGEIGVIDPVSGQMYILDPETLEEVDVISLSMPSNGRWHCRRGRQHFNDFTGPARDGGCMTFSSFANGLTIYRPPSGQPLLDLVDAQPHSVTEDEDGVLWWCESAKGMVCNGRDGAVYSAARVVNAYPRGLYVLDGQNEEFLVGHSVHRTKRTAYKNAWVSYMRLDKESRVFDLPAAQEVYGIARLWR